MLTEREGGARFPTNDLLQKRERRHNPLGRGALDLRQLELTVQINRSFVPREKQV